MMSNRKATDAPEPPRVDAEGREFGLERVVGHRGERFDDGAAGKIYPRSAMTAEPQEPGQESALETRERLRLGGTGSDDDSGGLRGKPSGDDTYVQATALVLFLLLLRGLGGHIVVSTLLV